MLTSALFDPKFRLEDLRAYGIDVVHDIELEIAGKTIRIENVEWKVPEEE